MVQGFPSLRKIIKKGNFGVLTFFFLRQLGLLNVEGGAPGAWWMVVTNLGLSGGFVLVKQVALTLGCFSKFTTNCLLFN